MWGAYIKILVLYCTYGCACIACMATLMVRVSEGQKQLWVEAAFEERVSLSEWVRRRCDAGLTAGDQRAEPEPGSRRQPQFPGTSSPAGRTSAPAVSPDRSFRPDPKGAKK